MGYQRNVVYTTRPARTRLAHGNGLQQASHLITQAGHHQNRTATETFALFGISLQVGRPGMTVLIQKLVSSVNIVVEVPMLVGSCAVFPLLY